MFEVKGIQKDETIDFICEMADRVIDNLMVATKSLDYAMQFKAFTLLKIHDHPEEEKKRFLQLTDVLQAALLRSMERYREESKKYAMNYGVQEDASEYNIWLDVKVREDDTSSMEAIPEDSHEE